MVNVVVAKGKVEEKDMEKPAVIPNIKLSSICGWIAFSTRNRRTTKAIQWQ
jgi:hypothetical protein